MASYKRVILKSDNISELTNDAGYITSVGSVSWGDISGKPSIFMHDYATVTGNPTFAGTTTFTGDIYTSGHIRPTDGVLTLYDNTSGSWGRLSAQGVNLGDWYRQPTYGQIAVGAYTFRVFKGDSSSSTTLVSVNQSGVMQLGDGGNSTNWNTAYSWGNHASAGYLTAVPNALELKTSSGHIKFFDTDEGDTADYFRLEKDGGRLRLDFYDNSAGASSNNIFMVGDDGQVNAKSFFADSQMAIDGVGFNKSNLLNWNTAYSWGDHREAGYLTSHQSLSNYATLNSTNTFTGTNLFRDTTTQIQNTTAWSGKATLGFKVTGTGSSDFYGGIQLTRQGSSGYNSQLEFQTSIYNNNLRTVMTLNSAGSLHLDGTVYANGVIGLNSGGFAIGSIASYNRIDFQSGTFRTLFANGSIAPLQTGDLNASTINASESTFTTRVNTGQIRFTDSSKTSFNHLNVAQWATAYNWGNHADAGYSKFSGSYDDLTNKPSLDGNIVYNQNIQPLSIRQYWADSTPAGTQFNNAFSAPNGSSTRAVYFDGGAGTSAVSTWYGVANKPYGAIDVSQSFVSIWTNNTAGTWKRMLDALGDGSLVRANVNFQSTGVITANGGNSDQWNTAYGWGNHADARYLTSHQSLANYTTKGSNISQFANNSGYLTSSDIINWSRYAVMNDTRSTLIAPYSGGKLARWDFKYNSKDGLNDGGTYHTVLQVNQWSDNSGGKCHQLGFTDNNNVWTRVNSNDSTWGSWTRLALASEIPSLSGYATQSWVNSQGFLKSETDSQTLSISGKSLSISGGNSVTLPSYSDSDVRSFIESDDGIRAVRFDFQSYDTYWDSDATNSKENNTPMSIKLWDSYNNLAKSGTDSYGTILDIYGRSGHQRNQFFMGNSGYMWHRSTFYNQGGWQNWYKFWSTKNLEANVVTSLRANYNKWLTSHQSLANYATLNGVQTFSANKTFSSNLYVGGNLATDSITNYRGSQPVTLNTDKVIIGKTGIQSVPNKLVLRGHSVPYSGGGYLSGEGWLEFDSNVSWTGAQRRWAITNAYNMGGGGAGELAFLVGTDSAQYPTLGTNGALSSVDGEKTVVGMRITGGGVIHARTGNSDNWNTAYGWGNHASIGYATSSNPYFTGHIRLTGSGRIIGGFGAVTTAGTTDWNHDTNAISGQGYTLLLGGATNGHGFDNDYYHPFNFEYARNDGYGNMTQLAVPYSGNGAFAFRSRYNNVWSSWRRIIDTGIISAYADKTPSWVPSSDPGYLTSSSTINATTLGNIGLNLTGVNNNPSKVMATDGNGYANFGWINTTSGKFTGTPNRIYASSDQYMRYMTLEDFRARIFDVSGGGDSIGTTDGQNFHIKTNGQYRISLTSTGDIGLLGPTILKTNNTKLHGITSGSATIGLIGVRSDNWIELGESGFNLTSKSPFYAEADAFIHKATPQLELKDTSNNVRGYIGVNNGVLKVGTKDNAGFHLQSNGTDRAIISNSGDISLKGYTSIQNPGKGLFVQAGYESPYTQNIAEFKYGGNSNSIIIKNVLGQASISTSGTSLQLSANDNVGLTLNTNKSAVFGGAVESGSHHPSGDSTVDLGHSGARWRQIHATYMYTTSISVDGRSVSGATIDNIALGVGANSWGNHASVGYYKNGSTINISSMTNSGSYAMAHDLEMTKKLYIAFDHGTANQKANIFLGGDRFWGEIIVTVVSGYSHQNASGVLKVSYGLGLNQNGGEYSNGYTTLACSGQTPSNFSLDDAWRYDSGAKAWYLVISHLNANGNQAYITLEAKASGNSNQYIHDAIKGSFAGSVYTNTNNYPNRGFQYSNSFNIKAPNLLLGSYLNADKTTNVGSNANGITIVGEHAPTLSLWDTSSSGFHSHVYQVGSDMTLRSSGTLSLQVAGGTRAMRLNSDKSVTFDGEITSSMFRLNGTSGYPRIRQDSDNFYIDTYARSSALQLTNGGNLQVEGGNARIIAKGSSNGYVNGAFVTSSIDINRGGGLFMHDRGNQNEWFCGRPYSNNDQFIIARNTGVADHSGATAQESNASFKIDNNGNVSIIASSPQTKYVNASGTTLGYVFGNSNGFGLLADSGHWAYNITANSTQHTWSISNVNKLTLTSTELRMVGQISASGGNSANWNTAYGWGDHSKAGYQTARSDIRLKTNISTIETPLDKISKLRGVTFDWKEHTTKNTVDTGGGVIAQEVEKVMPEFVHDIGNGSGMKTVDYNGLIGVLIESVKELKEQVNNCKCNCNCKGD